MKNIGIDMHLPVLWRTVIQHQTPRHPELQGLKFEVIPSKFEETLDKSSFSSPQAYVVENARQKTLEVKERLGKDGIPDLIIGADTVVALDGKILEKPKDANNAFEMLSSLSGRTHSVHTGVVFVASHQKAGQLKTEVRTFFEDTDVTFGDLTSDIINAYIATGEPLDKAGGYGIQALGGTLVKGIVGDYFNVVGFPLHKFCKELLNIHQTCWS
ncbi:putative N-acetylserotonin O-methyltransferase-like protein-like [Apostichopus japonicus]|uniref:Putative N-acetylserotonin O-methyltransferase-like protein-like n=1 Tax=Stichopus japonicus TaxID=307972 RepID=A0A2G8JRA2_STIJA|nr:putative N-acetylserotonin O-methyltransferase-like protein-like [Apostichopus japonicus]